MDSDFPEERAAFIFSDPGGRRWPRLRLALLFGGIIAFIATVFFVETLSSLRSFGCPSVRGS